METRRNEPCPCGSGEKYKKCCGSLHDTSKSKTNTTMRRHEYDTPHILDQQLR
ncbi:SEC-C metal-binding domain-containing protein [Methylosoma difficile]